MISAGVGRIGSVFWLEGLLKKEGGPEAAGLFVLGLHYNRRREPILARLVLIILIYRYRMSLKMRLRRPGKLHPSRIQYSGLIITINFIHISWLTTLFNFKIREAAVTSYNEQCLLIVDVIKKHIYILSVVVVVPVSGRSR